MLLILIGIIAWIAFCGVIVAICAVAKQGDDDFQSRLSRSAANGTLPGLS